MYLIVATEILESHVAAVFYLASTCRNGPNSQRRVTPHNTWVI